MSEVGVALSGQETLIASWEALAQTSPAAQVTRSSTLVADAFPAWRPLNNAIVLDADDGAAVSSVGSELFSLYAEAGVDAWALWVPSRATDLDATDETRGVDGFKRDTTTLVMQATLRAGLSLVPAENYVRAGQAACWYSWMMPPSRSLRRTSKRARRSGSVMGAGTARSGAAWRIAWWGRCSL
jgi:hypothetical protein